jgi:hypothetical protein
MGSGRAGLTVGWLMVAVALAAAATALLARRVRMAHSARDATFVVAQHYATRVVTRPPRDPGYLSLDGTDYYVPSPQGFQLLYDAVRREQGADRYDWAIALAGLAAVSAAVPAVRRAILSLVPGRIGGRTIRSFSRRVPTSSRV